MTVEQQLDLMVAEAYEGMLRMRKRVGKYSEPTILPETKATEHLRRMTSIEEMRNRPKESRRMIRYRPDGVKQVQEYECSIQGK